MHPAFSETAHRPWPLPARPWVMRQTWSDLLFAHWPVPAATLRPLVPPELNVEEKDGTSWVAVVPFYMSGVTGRGMPSIPGISAFAECNVRLYVERDGKPGLWFLSLDAESRLAVWAARRFVHLPYFHARMSVGRQGGQVRYQSQRRAPEQPARKGPPDNRGTGSFSATYRSVGAPYQATPGSLEHFLTERYCLYSRSPTGRLYRIEVHHRPWPIERAEATIAAQGLLAADGLGLDGPPALLHFARRLDVVVFPPERLL